jgi:hypothetical protein
MDEVQHHAAESAIDPEMSQSTIRFGQRLPGPCGPAPRSRPRGASLSRKVRRASKAGPWHRHGMRRDQGADRQRQARQHAFRLGDFGSDICSKSSVFSRSSGDMVAVASISIFSSPCGPRPRAAAGAGRPAAPRPRAFRRPRRAVLCTPRICGQHQRHHVFKIPRIAPEEAEDLGEDGAFLGRLTKQACSVQ